MPSNRHSKRLAGAPPSEEQSAKRARKPNGQILSQFSKTQQPIVRASKPKKRAKKSSKPKTTAPEKEIPIELSSTPAGPIPSSLPIKVEIPTRPPRAKAPPLILFDPSNKGKNPHYVSLYIMPVINNLKKDIIFRNININDFFRPKLDSLVIYIYIKVIKPWEKYRRLKASEKPR